MLQNYSYPGNVRELENMIERAVLMARGRVVHARTLSCQNQVACEW